MFWGWVGEVGLGGLSIQHVYFRLRLLFAVHFHSFQLCLYPSSKRPYFSLFWKVCSFLLGCVESHMCRVGESIKIYKSLPKQTFKGSSYFHSHLPGCQVWPIPETFRGNVGKIGYFFGFSHFWLRIQLFFGLLSQLSLVHLLSSFQHFSHYFFS